MKKILFVLSLTFSAAFFGCETDKNESLRRQIMQCAKDQNIDEEEWGKLLEAAKGTDYEECSKLSAFVQSSTQRRGTPKMPACKAAKAQEESSNCSVFIENSGSMIGYFNGATEFKDVLMDIPSRIQSKGGKCKFYFITKTPTEISGDYKSFIEKLDKETANQTKGKVSVLDEMLIQVSDIAIKEKRIALFASDFIYDVGNKNPKDVLPKAQYAIKDQLQKYRKSGDYGVLVLKMNSLFDGYYYNFKGGNIKLKERRPYYIWMFGSTTQLIDLFRNLNLDNLKGFEDYVIFYPDKGNADAFYSVLLQTNNQGAFKRDKTTKDAVHKIIDAKADERQKSFQFALAVDLSSIPTNKNYLTNIANYELKSDKNNSFELVSIEAIDAVKLHNNDEKRYKGTATHVFTFKTDKITADAQTLQLRLLKQMPNWIEKSSSDDDIDIKSQLNKTFGLKQIMNGLMDAYILPGTKPAHIQFDIEISK